MMVLQKMSILVLLLVVGAVVAEPRGPWELDWGLDEYRDDMVPDWCRRDEIERSLGSGTEVSIFDLLSNELASFGESHGLIDIFNITGIIKNVQTFLSRLDSLLIEKLEWTLEEIIEGFLEIVFKLKNVLVQKFSIDFGSIFQIENVVKFFLRVRYFFLEKLNFKSLKLGAEIDNVFRVIYQIINWFATKIQAFEGKFY